MIREGDKNGYSSDFIIDIIKVSSIHFQDQVKWLEVVSSWDPNNWLLHMYWFYSLDTRIQGILWREQNWRKGWPSV